MILKPFFYYYGSKYRIIPKYPKPKYATIIEPFCGSATYSLCYANRHITLYDKDEAVVGIWNYLINSSSKCIMKLPSVIEGAVNDYQLCQEAKWLISCYISQGGGAGPHRGKPTARSRWKESAKARIAHQLQYIKHWKCEHRDYKTLDNPKATWFIDPPYFGPAGSVYKFSRLDYSHLANWCISRNGQAVVCEELGSEWLPFTPLTINQGGTNKWGVEVVWINNTQ